jgi:hypothetical protein
MSRKVRPRMASALQLSKLKHAHLKVKVCSNSECLLCASYSYMCDSLGLSQQCCNPASTTKALVIHPVLRGMSESYCNDVEGCKFVLLAAQVENDVYCTYANRANSEFKYSPVPSNTNITTLASARLQLALVISVVSCMFLLRYRRQILNLS